MKKLLGVDLAGSWKFTPGIAGAGTISFVGPTIGLNQVLLVTNTTRNLIIYNFADAAKGAAAFSGNTLTLDADTSTHSSGDSLQIYLDVDEAMPVDVAPQGTMAMLLARILGMLLAPLGYRKDLQRYMASVILESGTVSTVSTVSTVTTVTTCSTVTNVAQLGGLSADRLINSANLSAWAACHRARIT